MDAAGEDRDIKLLQVSNGLFDNYFTTLPQALRTGDGAIRYACNRKEIERLISLVSIDTLTPSLNYRNA
jgi:hypothetical protein